MNTFLKAIVVMFYPVTATFTAYAAYEIGTYVGMSDSVAFLTSVAMIAGWFIVGLGLLDRIT